jgi:hypothetical protein
VEATEPAVDPRPDLPSFPRRMLDVFLSPGHVMEALARRPAWATALVVGALLVVLQVWLIPMDIWEANFREIMLQRGQPVEGLEVGGTFMRLSGIIGGMVGWTVINFLVAGILTFLFTFILGDEGRYAQYLSVVTHAWLIPALVGLALVPLRISQADPQLTLNVGTFFFFLPEGYLLKVLTLLDFSQLWALLVVAQGAHAIEPRRSFGSATAILLVLNLVLVLILATFAPV